MNCAYDFANNKKTFSDINAKRVFVQLNSSGKEKLEANKKKT